MAVECIEARSELSGPKLTVVLAADLFRAAACVYFALAGVLQAF